MAAEDGGDEGDDAEGAAALFDRRGRKDELPGVKEGRRRTRRRSGVARTNPIAATSRRAAGETDAWLGLEDLR
jgi:hypothetical protein